MAIKHVQYVIAIKELYHGLTLQSAIEKHKLNYSKFFDAMNEDPELEAIYVRARWAQCETFCDEVISIADDETANPNTVRNRIEARKWFTSKINPSKFGDRIELNVNQMVSVSKALDEAKARVRQVVEITALPELNAPSQTEVVENGNQPEIDLPDIFS